MALCTVSPHPSTWGGGQTQAHFVPRGDVHGLVRAGGQAGSMLLCGMDEVLSPQSFSRGSLSPNGLVLGRVAGTWVLGVSSPAGLVLLRAEAERALLTWGHSRGGCAGWEHGPQLCQKLTLVAASQPPDCDSNVFCLSPQPGEL